MKQVVSRSAVCLDDVVLDSDTWNDHVLSIWGLFDRWSWEEMTVNLVKCEFAKATVTYLGKVVSWGDVWLVYTKVLAVDQFPSPVTKKEGMRFLGIRGYNLSFRKNFLSAAAPLRNHLKFDSTYIWSFECQSASEEVFFLCTNTGYCSVVWTLPSLNCSDSVREHCHNIYICDDCKHLTATKRPAPKAWALISSPHWGYDRLHSSEKVGYQILECACWNS